MKMGLKSKLELPQMTADVLLRLYRETVEALRECANINPANDFSSDRSDKLEFELLDYEANLLDHAAAMPLSTKQDVTSLIDMWLQVSGIDINAGSDEAIEPSDRIAINIFRHIMNGNLNKG